MEHTGTSTNSSSAPLLRKRTLDDTGFVGQAPAQRKRNAVACSVCRARKTKCDNKKPRCSYCSSIGAACDTEEPLSARQRLTGDSQAILERIDLLEQKLLQSTNFQHFSSPVANNLAVTPALSSTPIAHRDAASPGAPPSLDCKIYPAVESVLAWPVFEGQYKPFLNLRNLMFRGSEIADRSSPQSGRGSQLPIGLDIELCSGYLDDFFNRIHIKNPILEENEIRRWARDIAFNGFRWDARSCLVIVLCALGAISMPFALNDDGPLEQLPNSENKVIAEAWFEASQKRIGMLLSRGGGLLEAQCFFFSGVYLMHTFRPFAAWSLFVQAMASCQTFQCFGNVSEHAEFDTTEIENGRGWHTEESMYWTCFKSELEIRCQLNPPGFTFSDLSYPEFLPLPPPESIQNQDQAWFFYLGEIALRQLTNKVLTHILPYSSGQQLFNLSGLANITTDFESQIEHWSRLLPPESGDVQPGPYTKNILSFILNMQALNCYETMYWPYIATAINFPAQRDLAFDIYVERGLQASVNKINNREAASHHRHHGTWLAMRQCNTSAIVLVAAKKCGQLENLIPKDWREAVRRSINFLDFWSGECGDAGNRRDILEEALRNII